MKTGLRSVSVFGVVFATGTAMLWFGKLGATEWVSLTQWTFAPLMAGIASNHFGKAITQDPK